MEDEGKPKSAAHKLSETQVKQLKASLKESANKYDELLAHISNYQKEEDRRRKDEIEEVIHKEMKFTIDQCVKLQREIELIEQKSRQTKSADGNKKNASAFAADFRLTPEEQDIAYEFKAHVMRKIHSQNQNIKKELELHEKKVNLKKGQQTFKKQIEEHNKSQSTLIHLTNAYEKRALTAESKVMRLKEQLRQADEIIARYDQAYHRDGGDPTKMRQPQLAKGIRVDDVIRRNEALTNENIKLRQDITRMKTDNMDLIKAVKCAEAERDETMHALGTCDMARQELAKRFSKEQKEHKVLRASLTRQASDWIQGKKQYRQYEEVDRQDQMQPLSPLDSKSRLYQYPVKKNVDKPRQTIIV